jgi:3-deoxy-D-manno-octulosonic-acid transferase
MIWLYRLVMLPVFILGLPLLALFNRKVREGLKLRIYNKLPPSAMLPINFAPIWIHAASGEFEYAKPVVRELKNKYPHIPVVVTYFSPSFAKAVHSFPGVDYAFPLPLDLPGPCISFIKRMKPRLCLIARTDFWPEMLYQLRTRNIPVWVFSYTQKDPKQISGIKKVLTKSILNRLTRIDCVSPVDVENLNKLGLTTAVHFAGDTRYDQVQARLETRNRQSDKIEHWRSVFVSQSTPVLVAGSTWPEDENVLFKALSPILENGSLKLILVPHEPTASHLKTLKDQLEKQRLSYSLFTEMRNENKNVLLVDTVGVLAELYSFGNLAFVGGSFAKSVHSVMEPLATGCHTFVGPKNLGNREAQEFKSLSFAGIPAVREIQTASEWQTLLETDLKNLKLLNAFSDLLKKEMQSRLGASRKLVQSLNLH